MHILRVLEPFANKANNLEFYVFGLMIGVFRRTTEAGGSYHFESTEVRSSY